MPALFFSLIFVPIRDTPKEGPFKVRSTFHATLIHQNIFVLQPFCILTVMRYVAYDGCPVSYTCIPLAVNHQPEISWEKVMELTVPKRTTQHTISLKLGVRSNCLWQLCLATKQCTWLVSKNLCTQ